MDETVHYLLMASHLRLQKQLLDRLKGTGLTVTHINLLDNTVEGLQCRADKVFSVQYHPESAPGPQDSGYLFDQFITMMEEGKRHA